MLIWPEASCAQNNMAAVYADGSTVCVLLFRFFQRRIIFFLIEPRASLLVLELIGGSYSWRSNPHSTFNATGSGLDNLEARII
jgi:hypothetical protein